MVDMTLIGPYDLQSKEVIHFGTNRFLVMRFLAVNSNILL